MWRAPRAKAQAPLSINAARRELNDAREPSPRIMKQNARRSCRRCGVSSRKQGFDGGLRWQAGCMACGVSQVPPR